MTSRAIDVRGAGEVSTQWLTSSSEPRVPPRLGSQVVGAASSARGVEAVRRLLRDLGLLVHPRPAPGSFSISTSTRSSRSISSRSVGHGGLAGAAVDLADQAAVADQLGGVGGVGVVLDREDQDLLGMRDEEAVHAPRARRVRGVAPTSQNAWQRKISRVPPPV